MLNFVLFFEMHSFKSWSATVKFEEKEKDKENNNLPYPLNSKKKEDKE